MSDDRAPVERAAEVAGRHLGAFQNTATKIALDLYAVGLLVDADTERQRTLLDLCWRSIVKMAAAAGPAYTPRWVLDLMDDDGNLPADPWTLLDAIYAEAGVTTEGDGG